VQAITIDEDNSTQYPFVVHAGLGMGLRDEELKTRHLWIG
jgi:hypothetical protein